jgi:hypothetical protein
MEIAALTMMAIMIGAMIYFFNKMDKKELHS